MMERRYYLLESLGAGGMGMVSAALDRLTGERIALKQVNTLAPAADLATADAAELRMALTNEFRVLASLHHPYIINVRDYGFDDGGRPFFTMELLDHARTLVEAAENQPRAVHIDLIGQLFEALAYLHRRQIIHCDLKPSNILVVHQRVKVLDFGLSVIEGRTKGRATRTSGTLAYIAPEVLLGIEANQISDLYAAGVIAYEILTGRYPFDRNDINHLITQVLHEFVDLTPFDDQPGLAFFFGRVLAKSPDERYSSADEALSALYDAVGQAHPAKSVEIRESYWRAAPLVGRDAEIGRLHAALADTVAGSGSAWLITGTSGVGKSRIVEELTMLAMVEGAPVLCGGGVNEGSTPYHLWRGIIRWLSLLNDLSDEAASAFLPFVPDLENLLGRSVTVLEETDPKTRQKRLIQAIEQTLRTYGKPLVLTLEDLQWAGSDSLAILKRVIKLTRELPLLVIASARSEDLHTSALKDIIGTLQQLPLPPLNTESIMQLSAAMLGKHGTRPEVVAQLQAQTAGNVFYLIETVRALSDSFQMGSRLDTLEVSTSVLEGGMTVMIERVLDRVPVSARALLKMAAITSRTIDLRLLQALAPEVDLEQWSAICANADILEYQENQWRFSHDQLRERILDTLGGDEIAVLSERVARAVEQIHADTNERATGLAFLWARAGSVERERYYSTISGKMLLRCGAYQEAEAYLQRSLALLGSAATADSQRERIIIERLLAETMLGQGGYDAARQLYESVLVAARLLHDAPSEALVHALLGDVAYAQDDLAAAETHYRASLAQFKGIGDRQGIANTLSRLGNVAFDLDQVGRATQLYQESLAINRALGNQWGMAGSIADEAETDGIAS